MPERKANERPGADAGWRVLFAFQHPRFCATQGERLPHMWRRLHILLVSVALLLTACRDEKLSPGFHRAGAKEFSRDEAKAVSVARAELEKEKHKSIDAIYRVTAVPEGYSVHVEYVAGYHHGQPIGIPGGFCVVLVSTQWTVIKILPGA